VVSHADILRLAAEEIADGERTGHRWTCNAVVRVAARNGVTDWRAGLVADRYASIMRARNKDYDYLRPTDFAVNRRTGTYRPAEEIRTHRVLALLFAAEWIENEEQVNQPKKEKQCRSKKQSKL